MSSSAEQWCASDDDMLGEVQGQSSAAIPFTLQQYHKIPGTWVTLQISRAQTIKCVHVHFHMKC